MKNSLIGIVLLASGLWGQTSTPAQPAFPLKGFLGLTDSQIESIKTIRQQAQTSIAPLRAQAATQEKELQTALANGGAAVELGQMLLDLQSLRKRIATQEADARTQILTALTEEQKTKLQTLVRAARLEPIVQQARSLGLIPPNAPAARTGQ